MLQFSRANKKLKKLAKAIGIPHSKIYSFDLPAGYSCPFADICKSTANKQTGKIADGPSCKFRCYAASQEAMYANTRAMRWRNFDALRKTRDCPERMWGMIEASIPKNAKVIRIHASGDFYNQRYALAWCKVAQSRPDIVFYAYTKSMPYFLGMNIPDNFRLTQSIGGLADNVRLPGFGECHVVSETIEHHTTDIDDSHAYRGNFVFDLVVHGTQPKGGAKI